MLEVQVLMAISFGFGTWFGFNAPRSNKQN